MPNLAALDKKDDKAGEEQQSSDQQQQSAEEIEAVEREAALFGWVPKDEFQGDPAEWADAATFVERGKAINPLLRKNNQRLMKELEKRDRQIAELQLTTKEFGEMYAKMSETAYKRAIEEVNSQIRTARREGNDDDVETLMEQRDQLKEDAKSVKIPGKDAGTQSAAAASAARQAVLDQWISENSWYDEQKNPGLYFAAEGIASTFVKTEEGRALAGTRAFLDKVAEKTRAAMPEAFKNPRRKEGSPVDGTRQSRSDTGGGGKKTYADLPAEAKAACDRQVKTIPKFTREKYVEYYFDQPGA